MALKNGQIPDALLYPAQGTAGARLRLGPAEAWKVLRSEVNRRFGWTPTLTSAADAYRSLAIQTTIFLQRYQRTRIAYAPGRYDMRAWNGVAYWRKPGYAAAAVPGTSNHGWGRAADISGLGGFNGTRYKQLKLVAIPLGWSNVEGASVEEAWHWTYEDTLDTVSNIISGIGKLPTVPSLPPVTPITPVPEEDIVASLDDLHRALDAKIAPLIARIDALEQADFYRMQGTYGVWRDLGTARRAVGSAEYVALGRPPLDDLPVDDPFWDLQPVGFPTELFRQKGDNTLAVWVRVPGGRQHVTGDQFAVWRKPTLTDLESAHAFWNLPVIPTSQPAT
jgi:hypothetical protein